MAKKTANEADNSARPNHVDLAFSIAQDLTDMIGARAPELVVAFVRSMLPAIPGSEDMKVKDFLGLMERYVIEHPVNVTITTEPLAPQPSAKKVSPKKPTKKDVK